MPTRPVTIAIVAFWLLTAGWFAANEMVPAWRSGDPPPYKIDYADEVIRSPVPYRWVCTLNGQKLGTVKTLLVNDADDDMFEFSAVSAELTLPVTADVSIRLTEYDDRVRVTRSGELRSISTTGTLSLVGAGLPVGGRFSLKARADHGLLDRHVHFTSPQLGDVTPTLPQVPTPRGNILNPMHPVPRIVGLEPGRTWCQPLVDPRSDMIRAALAQSPIGSLLPPVAAPRDLSARVLARTESLVWEAQEQPCLVIEYRADDYTARTWVRQSDGLVLRQEAGGHGDKLVLQRE
jgi:hypothetical protein